MKYPQSVPMPRDVKDWLENELEARGIDAVVYTRYILSLMQPSPSLDFQIYDYWPHLPETKAVWNKDRRDRKQKDNWHSWDHDAKKRLAVVSCLMTASGQKCEIESLVDELCAKLKEIQGGAADEVSAFHKSTTDTPPYADYNKAFPPLLEDEVGFGRAEPSDATSAWTRGILRAAQNRTDTAQPYVDTINTQDCFSLMYCGPRKINGDYMEFLTEQAPMREDVKRLYERSAERHHDRVIARHDSIQEIWNPDFAAPIDAVPPGYHQNQAYFSNDHKLFSPTLFSYGNADDPVLPPTSWSLGGTITTLPNHRQSVSCFKEVAPRPVPDEHLVEVSGLNDCLAEEEGLSANIPEEEDLLTSTRTHFRPIRCEEWLTHPPIYEDGATFDISTEIEPLQYQRSESGTLFLESGKYMEFKKEEDGLAGGKEFVPKFRVRQSNEKFCQTEDVEVMAALCEQVVPDSPKSSVSDPDEFFFPGDDKLALDLKIENLLAEDEVEQIVSGRLDVRWKASVTSPMPVVVQLQETSEMEANWDVEDAALLDELVVEDTGWKQAADCNYNTLIDTDDTMDSVDGGEGDKVNSYWLQYYDSVWNPNKTAQACDTCNETPTNKFVNKIWGQSNCEGCYKEDDNGRAAQDAWNSANSLMKEIVPTEEKDQQELPAFWTISNLVPGDEPVSGPKQEEPVTNGCWNSFGPICYEDPNGVWESTLAAYLEERRLRVSEKFKQSPVNISGQENSGKKASNGVLRDIWSPDSYDDDGGQRMTASESREIWNPFGGYLTQNRVPSVRPSTYCLLRDELSEDGDQLLSDLSCLHLQQLGSADATEASDIQEEDSFPTAPPSPDWGRRFVNFCATCNVIGAIGEDNPNIIERPYKYDTAQKERKRRHSSSQKVCELYIEVECRRHHFRFRHGRNEDADRSPLYTKSPCLSPHTIRFGRDLQRAFTL